MAIGADSLAIGADAAVQESDVAALQRQLRENPLAEGGTPESLIDDLDDAAVETTGKWERTSSEGKFGLTALRHDGSVEAAILCKDILYAAIKDRPTNGYVARVYVSGRGMP